MSGIRVLLSALVAGALVFSAGCVVVPTSLPSEKVVGGEPVDPATLASFKVGESTRQEVLESLGAPTFDIREYNTIVYTWLQHGGSYFLIAGAGYAGAIGSFRAYNPHSVVLAFDKHDKLAAAENVEWRFVTGSMVERTRTWLTDSKLPVPDSPEHFKPVAVPDDGAVIYVYRTGPAPGKLTYSYPGVTSVALDGQFRAELSKQSYVAFVVGPGRHVIAVNPCPLYRRTSYTPPCNVATLEIEAETDSVSYLRTDSGTGWGSIETLIEQLPETQALDGIKNLKPAW